jgi:hypothetical protein
MKKMIRVSNTMQKGYTYELVEPIGKNFAPDFRPDLSPKQLLALGIFGGVYMRDCTREYPTEWFTRAKFAQNGIRTHVAELNYFKINASQSLSVWRAKGWISLYDPRGWFEWYCRYYMGRRIPDEDARQIKRWHAIRRHVGQIVANCRAGDVMCRRRQRQALLHWAYDSRKI